MSVKLQICEAQSRADLIGSGIVVDERLAALRAAPHLSASLLKRLGKGRKVVVLRAQRSSDGTLFYRVAVTRRTRGWLQREALVFPRRSGDDAKLLRLIKVTRDFDRIVRARIFLEAFPRSPLRPAVLLILGDEATKAASKLSQDAERRLDVEEMNSTGASLTSYFLNYSGIDRYRRQGIVFRFDAATRQFRYGGDAWNELLLRHRSSPEAALLRKRL